MRTGLKNLRGQKHVAPVVDYVRHCGGDDVQVTQNGHVRVGWCFEGQPMHVGLPVTPRSVDRAARRGCQEVRRRYREHGVEVRA